MKKSTQTQTNNLLFLENIDLEKKHVLELVHNYSYELESEKVSFEQKTRDQKSKKARIQLEIEELISRQQQIDRQLDLCQLAHKSELAKLKLTYKRMLIWLIRNLNHWSGLLILKLKIHTYNQKKTNKR